MEIKGIVNIGVEHIHPHPENPRKDLGDLSELVESIKKNGVMQNLTVIPVEDQPGEYMLIIGHRRCAAAKEAGVEELPCRIIEGMTEKEQVSTMLEENMQRADLTIYEQAQGFQMMLDLGETEDSIAAKTGFSKTTIRRRLNIAKLNPEVLKEKEQQEGFQLTLTDLYELEKIEDVEVRNKILSEASDSKNLAFKAQTAVKEAEKAKKKAQIIEKLEESGISEAPESYRNEMYSNKWQTVEEFSYSEEVPEEIELEETEEPMFYYPSWNGIKVVKKVKKEQKDQKEKTPEELEREQKDKNKKEIKAMTAKMNESRKVLVQGIIEGKIEAIGSKEVSEVKDAIWNILVSFGTGIYPSTIRGFITGKDDYKCTQEEREEAQKKAEALSVLEQMLIILHHAMATVEIVDYSGKYKAETGQKLQRGYEIFERYGWSFEDAADKQILDGTHELYEKEENDDEERD